MTDPVPVMVLARLAVDKRALGINLGASLLQDAVSRAVAETWRIIFLAQVALHSCRLFYRQLE